jgi:uncharacterized LabA/DUF88 family protein
VDRFGIFVDAGYLYAASGNLCFGVTKRSRLALDFRSINDALIERTSSDCGMQHLRTYWYDGARDAQPTPQHLEIAHLPGVKLRLGRLTEGGQKGVDSRIVRDLLVLSQQGAISTAFLIGGDEDLREGVSEAQERGVKVVLVGVEPLNERNLSPTLAMEADNVSVLDRAFIEPHFELREEIAVPEPGIPADEHREDIPQASEVGHGFGVGWARTAPSADLESVVSDRPRVPLELDRALLSYARQRLGSSHIEDDDRKALRSGFWRAIDELSGAS